MNSIRSLSRVGIGAGAVVTVVFLVNAEPLARPQRAAPLKFEVVSLRPGRPFLQQQPTVIRCKGVDGELEGGSILETAQGSPPQGRCTADNVPLTFLVARAYGVDPLRVVGLPNLGEEPSYQIQAAAEDPSRATKAELQQMLQTLLTDRLKLKVHRETKALDGFVMTVAKSGIKFKETSGDEEMPAIRSASGAPPGPVPPQAVQVIIKARFKLKRLAELWAAREIPIVDRTGLPGLYDITLKFDLIQSLSRSGRGGGGGPEWSPPLPKAFEDQLGLHLEPSMVPVEYLVVDHVEKASEN